MNGKTEGGKKAEGSKPAVVAEGVGAATGGEGGQAEVTLAALGRVNLFAGLLPVHLKRIQSLGSRRGASDRDACVRRGQRR